MSNFFDDFGSSERYNQPKAIVLSVVRRKLILVHGSGTLGEAMRELKSELDSDGFDILVIPIPIEPVELVGVLLKVKRRRVRNDMEAQIAQEFQNATSADEISIAAHSYGTYLLVWWLNEQPIARLRNVILLASIARRSEISKLTKISDRVVVDVACNDKIPCVAQAFRPLSYEATGSFGMRGHQPAGIGSLSDRFFSQQNSHSLIRKFTRWPRTVFSGSGHGLHLEIDHFKANILPIVTENRVPNGNAANSNLTQKTIHAFRWTGIAIGALLIMLLAKLLY